MSIQWDMEKGLLAFMLVIILGMVGVIFWQNSVHDELLSRMPSAERQLADVGRLYRENHNLSKELANDSVAMGMTKIKYLFEQMTKSGIGKGSFDMDKAKTPEQFDGYEDDEVGLKPASAARSFSREAIARFLLFVETNTRRMTVTKLRLTMDRGGKAPEDHWQPIITVTDRRPLTGE
ncbi:MAG: hypothetical protein ACI9EF_001227 [Pseudohongiellaceae bacterium]|jgi:hypothetical protein